MRHLRRTSRAVVVGTLVASLLNLSPIGARAGDDEHLRQGTPIKHVVVIFQENVSFDHYFATYPHAANLPGESVFTARHHVPQIDTLLNAGLLAPHNPNSVQPFRLSRARNDTCDQDHGYTDEQAAMNGGKVDRFVETVGVGGPGCADYGVGRGLVMGYYDGSTVTALWNYARHFAMSDHFFNTTFGPSSPGALNLIAGQTGGAIPADLSTPFGADSIAGAVISDPQPFFDDCTTRDNVMMTGRNVGDLLNARNISWGFFQGGFKPTTPATFAADGRVITKATCATSHIGSDGKPKGDYIPHHQPFQYYASTSNPHHLPPSSVAAIGHTDQTNHQYDLSDVLLAPGRANLHRRDAEPTAGAAGVARHGGLHHLRRLRRVVRSRRPAHRESLHDRAGRLDLRRRLAVARRSEGPLRLRAPPAAAGHLAVRAQELYRSRRHRPELDPALH